MFHFRQTVAALCLILSTAAAHAQPSLSDSLQQELARTTEPERRIALLLDLKDLNEDTPLNLSYSIRLFREATAQRDTYAMTVAIVPMLVRYANYPEKRDSLEYCVRTLARLTPGTAAEGMDCYARMSLGYYRLDGQYDTQKVLAMAHRINAACDRAAEGPETRYEKAARLLLKGYAKMYIDYHERHVSPAMVPQIGYWTEAYALARQMPHPIVRKNFCNIIYYVLSGAYNQDRRYEEQVRLTDDYIGVLDDYYAEETRLGRRPYLYRDNSYVNPYRQLVGCAINIGRRDYAAKHFEQFRQRMSRASGATLERNRSYLYELGYLMHKNFRDYDAAIRYNDSLIAQIRAGRSYFRAQPRKITKVYRDRALLLENAGRYDEAYAAYELAAAVQDSVHGAERDARAATVLRSRQIEQSKLAQTHAMIRNRAVALLSLLAIGALLAATGVYFFRALRHNRRLKSDIQRHNRKAQESERMKSNFVNTICRGIRPPFDALDAATMRLQIAGTDAAERTEHLEAIRRNTAQLISTLDNMLEAANLDSLTEGLHFERTDIDELCRAELLLAERQGRSEGIEYLVDAPEAPCTVRTHPKYFAFVVRALLDNACKFTRQGRITVSYRADTARNELRVEVTDTGCGIAPERRGEIFRPLAESTEATGGLSLALCRLIARHLSGTIRLDDTYTGGARFIFTIPLEP